MKLHLSILKNLIDLPTKEVGELRKLLDDLGLEVKGIDDSGADLVFNIETLANRGDHLSALGVARELSARLLTPISFPKLSPDFAGLKHSMKLSVNTELCSRCALLEVSQSKQMNLRTEVLSCFGDATHPETPMVDLCNYLFFEIGHPTHAFDYDKIEGEVIIDVLDKEETILALDGKEYKVPAGAIVNRDRKKILDVAGVIGCANSMVTSSTKRFLVEAAVFDPVSVRMTARAMGISTDASYAFERGVDREAVLFALRRLVALSSNIGDDGLNVHALSYFEGNKTTAREITLRLDEVRRQFNAARFSEVEIQSRLKALGYGISAVVEKVSCNVSVPSWRLWDVENEADLIEDIARSISLSQIKLELPPLDYAPPAPSAIERVVYDLEVPLHGLGFQEVMTKNLYSNEEVTLLEQLDPEIRSAHVTIKNALEKSCSHLKVSNLIHLARLFESNIKRGISSFKVYETARLFRNKFESKGHPYESELDILSLAFGGRVKKGEFRKAESFEEEFYWFKGALEACFAKLKLEVRFDMNESVLLHPGRQARILNGKTEIGFFGQMHPKLSKLLNISEPMLYAELDLFLLSECFSREPVTKIEPSDYPKVVRDLTVKVKKYSFASEVLQLVKKAQVKDLTKFFLVDDFSRADEEFRRVSYRFVFQSAERTLTAAEVDTSMKELQETLEKEGFSLAG